MGVWGPGPWAGWAGAKGQVEGRDSRQRLLTRT